MEDHDGAYRVWRTAGLRGRTLVHVDAHHDLVASATKVPLTIANYCLAALEDGIVREIVWMVPDPTWQTPSARRAVFEHLRAISGEPPSEVSGSDGTLRELWVPLSSGARLRAGSWDLLST